MKPGREIFNIILMSVAAFFLLSPPAYDLEIDVNGFSAWQGWSFSWVLDDQLSTPVALLRVHSNIHGK